MYKLQLDREFSQDLFSESSKEIRDWVVNAIANIVVADDIIEKHEFVALQEAMGLLDSNCLLYTSPSPRDLSTSRMPSSA